MADDEITPNAQIPASTDSVSLAHTRWWEALLDEDVGALETLLADDLTFHSPYGTASTKPQFLEALRSGRLEYDSVTAEGALTRLHGETAIVTGQADIDFRSRGEPKFEQLYYTAVYRWTSTHWRMLAWQSTLRADATG
ncbi:MAG: nuclear transport factor 2 family protein [Chloroflexi bacterium]|nr:nuclear transport factor 2 family protein [Chloroflexota bacterium]